MNSTISQEQREKEEKLLEEHQGLIWSIVRRYLRSGVDIDDLYQLGCLGFLKAVRGYDETYGTQFSTYAVPKIMGEIRRFLRDDGPVKVSRSVREQGMKVGAARQRLEQTLGRTPRISELAEEVGLSKEETASVIAAGSSVVSLQQELSEGLDLQTVLGDCGIEEQILEQTDLSDAIKQLPENQKKTVALRFFHGMTQVEAARVLGVSQVQISRLEHRALQTLRMRMNSS